MSRNNGMPRLLSFFAGTVSFLFGLLSSGAQLVVKARDMVPPADAVRTFSANEGEIGDAVDWIGGEQSPQTWDFRSAPGHATHQYFYRDVTNEEVVQKVFPGARVAERLSQNNLPATDISYLRYFPGEGKETVGFSRLEAGVPSESPFSNPLLEIPEEIEMGERWDDETTFPVTLNVLGVPVDAAVRIDQKAIVDGWGEVILPEIGRVEALRVNIVSLWASVADILGETVSLGNTYFRTYVWVSPGYGTVATLISKESAEGEPPVIFETASAFERLTSASGFWESPVPATPSAAEGLTIVREEDGRLLLRWRFNDAPEVTAYVIERSSALGREEDPWQIVGETEALEWAIPAAWEGPAYLRVYPKKF